MSKHQQAITPPPAHHSPLKPSLLATQILKNYYNLMLSLINQPPYLIISPNLNPTIEENHILRISYSSQNIEFKKQENMRPKSQQTPSIVKLLVFGVFLTFFLVFAIRTSLSSSKENASPKLQPKNLNFMHEGTAANCSQACNKIPRSLAQALIQYSTSAITPQQTLKEISVTATVLENKSPCNFLVFGLGHDSLMWSMLNYGGRTIFLEEDEAWIAQIRRRFPMLESHHVTYDSKVNQANNLMEAGQGPECTAIGDPRYSMCQLALKSLPSEVYDIQWDLIVVDAPTGYYEEAPGRMTAIYTAGMIARNRVEGETNVFVHDVNREVEDRFSKAFLCKGYMKKQEGRLRHFTIPSHRDAPDRPFCPE